MADEKFTPPTDAVAEGKFTPPADAVVDNPQKKSEVTNAVSSNGLPTVSEPLQESGAKDSGPLDLPSSYQSDRSNYKDLVGGSKYKLLRGGKPITGTWDAESQTFIKEPLLDLTPKQKKEVGFLQAVEAGVNLEAPKETQEEVFGRVGVDIDNIKADSKNKLTNIEYLSSFPSVKKVAELETLRNATDDQKVKADIDTQIEMLRSQKMSADEFQGVRFSDGEQKVYQNYLPATGKVEEFKGSVKKLPKTDITVGEAYDEAKGDTEYVQQAQQEISQYNNMVNQYMIDKLPQESKDRLIRLKGTPEYDNELERELVQSNKIENVIPALAYGLDRKLDALMEVGSNLGLDDNRLAQKKLSDIREKQMFGKQMASTRADLASSIGGMLPDIAAGAVFSPLMLGSMTATMPNDFLEQSIAEQYERGEPINIAKAKEYALASTAAQTGLMVGAGLVGGQSINLLGKTALNRAGELITEMAKRGTKDAIVFGGLGTAMQNKINKAFDVAENDEYLKSALHMAIIGSMFALHAGYGKVKPLSKQKANEIDYLASYLPEEYTRKQVEQLVQQGKLGAADGEEISDKLNTYRTIRNQIPAELTSNQMEQIYPLWVERRRLQSMTKDASSEFKNVLNGEVEDIDRKILVKAAVPLTSSERAEKNKLSTAEVENKDIDKSRLRYLEQRDEAAKEVKAEKKIEEAKIQADAESSKGGDGGKFEPHIQELADWHNESKRIKAEYDKDWDGLSEQEKDKIIDDNEANLFQRDRLFDDYATDAEKKKAKELADKKDSFVEKVKEKIGIGTHYYDRMYAEHNFKEDVVQKLAKAEADKQTSNSLKKDAEQANPFENSETTKPTFNEKDTSRGDGEDAKPEAETGVEAVAENGKEEVVAEVDKPNWMLSSEELDKRYPASNKERFGIETMLTVGGYNKNPFYGKEKIDAEKTKPTFFSYTNPKSGRKYDWRLEVYKSDNGRTRYVAMDDRYDNQSSADAGLIIDKNGNLTAIRNETGRTGLTDALLKEAKKDFPNMDYVAPFSKTGQKFVKRTIIQDAIDSGKYIKAIEENKVTANDVVDIINSVGIDVPNEISNLAKAAKETKPEDSMLSEGESKLKSGSVGVVDVVLKSPEKGEFEWSVRGKDLKRRDVSINNNNAGTITIVKSKDGNIVQNILLNDNYTRKGIGEKVYQELNKESVNETGNPLQSSNFEDMNKDSVIFWNKLVDRGLATKNKNNYSFKEQPKPEPKIPNTDLSNSEAIKFLDDHTVDGPIQKYDLHPDFELSSEEIARGTKQIRNGEFDKVGAKKMLAKIDEWKRQGYVDYIRGSGKQMQKTSVPFELTEALANLPEEKAKEVIDLADKLEADKTLDEKLKNFTDENGDLDLAKLSEELRSAKDKNYWGDLLGFTDEELSNLQNIINDEQGKKTTNQADIESKDEGKPSAENKDYEVISEQITMPDGEDGVKVTLQKPDGEKIELGNMYPEDVEKEVANKIKGYKLQESKAGKPEEVKAEIVKKEIGEEIAFKHAGQEVTGKIVSIDGNGNYKVTEKDGTKYTVEPENARTPATMEQAKKSLADNMKKLQELSAPKKKDNTPPPVINAIVPTDVITAPFKLLGMGDKLISNITSKMEDGIANSFRQAMASSNKYLSRGSSEMQGIFKQLALSQEDIEVRRRALGQMNSAPLKAVQFYKNGVDIVGKTPESLQYVHQVLDPEVYTERGMAVKTEADLSPAEKNLYDLLRSTNDMIHDWHYLNGRITEETYLTKKGTYAPRFYDNIEFEGLPDELKNAFEDFSKQQNFSYVKERKKFSDVMQNNIVTEDPVYGTSMRLAQMLRNQAIMDYAAVIAAKTKVFKEGDTNIPNSYVKLEGAGQYGNINTYGDLTNKYVPRDIAEDFKGVVFINTAMDHAYSVAKWYNRTQIRQLLNKTKTLYNPITQLGNIGTNYVFAMMNGIDPLTYQNRKFEAAREVANKGDLYVKLVEEGVLGTDVITKDLKLEAKGVPKEKGILGKIDDKITDFYSSRDDIAKVAAYLAHTKDYGRSEADALKRIGEGFQNYNNVGRFFDFASKTPVVGNPFIKFKGDLLRIMKNNFSQRPLTNIAMLAGLNSIATMFSNLSDEDEDVRKARESRPFIPKVPLPNALGGDIPLVWQTPIGEINAARYFSPMNVYDMGDRGSSVEELTQFTPYQLAPEKPFTKFPDPFLGVYFQVAFDKDFRGQPILDPEENKYRSGNATTQEKIQNAATFIARQQIPFFAGADDMLKAYNNEPDYYGRNRDLKQALLSNIIKIEQKGKPEVVSDLKKEIDSKMYALDKLNKEIVSAKNLSEKNISKIKAQNNPNEQALIEREYKRAENKIAELMDEQAEIKTELIDPEQMLSKLGGKYESPLNKKKRKSAWKKW